MKKIIELHPRRQGKSETMRQVTEWHLDNGSTVLFANSAGSVLRKRYKSGLDVITPLNESFSSGRVKKSPPLRRA